MDKDIDNRFNKALEDSEKVFNILISDRKILFRHIVEAEDKEFWCRTYVRYLFADLEARSYQLRQMMLIWHKAGAVCLSPQEALFLQELTFRMNNKGEIEGSPAKLRTTDNLLFTFKIFSKATSHDVAIDTSNTEWGNFKKAIEIRDRITHPKTFEDLSITNEEITMVINVGEWIDKIFLELKGKFESVYEKLEKLGYLTHDK